MRIETGKIKTYCRLILIAVIAFSTLSCIRNADSGHPASDIRLALMVKRADNNWYQLLIKGFETRCRELDVQYLILDNRMDSNLTLSDIDTLISRKVNGVAIAIPEQKMSWIIVNRIFEAGLPVVSLNYKLIDKQDRQVAPHIGIDYIKAGIAAGHWIAERIREKNILTDPSISFGIADLYSKSVLEIQQWSENVKTALLKDIPTLNSDRFYRINSPVNDAAGAMITMQRLLSEHPNITYWIIYAGSSDEINGALLALGQVGMEKYSLSLSIEARTTGNNSLPETNPNRAVILVDTYNQGLKAAELLYRNAKGKVAIPSRTYSSYRLMK
ncbi:MAG: hypothetical protein DRP57_02405 [Spirochaetes bacterium]|nr:MAG: hypothetical protein DRP57_02405 [Spirochaetota bacterium]